MTRGAALLLGVILTCASLGADNVRGPVVHEVRLAAELGYEQTVGARYQEFVAVYVPSDTRFLDGIQIELVLSATLRENYDSFGIVIYDTVQPLPVVGERVFTGRRAFFHYLVSLNRLFYHLTVTAPDPAAPPGRHNPAQGLFRPPLPASPADYPILVGIVPIMKGIPDALRDQLFYFRITPRMADRGLLSLRLLPPESISPTDYSVLVDGAPLEMQDDGDVEIEMASGLHTLKVRSEALHPVDTTFSIEAGKTNRLEVPLRLLAATVTVEAPSIATVYIDGTRYDHADLKGLELAPGEHTVRFKIGDYSASRTFTVTRGKSYAVYLDLAIAVKEY